MKLGQGLRAGTVERLKLAIQQVPSIIVQHKDLDKTEGVPESFLLDLGLTKGDLQRLEVCGFAKRGYIMHRSGMLKRWVLVA